MRDGVALAKALGCGKGGPATRVDAAVDLLLISLDFLHIHTSLDFSGFSAYSYGKVNGPSKGAREGRSLRGGLGAHPTQVSCGTRRMDRYLCSNPEKRAEMCFIGHGAARVARCRTGAARPCEVLRWSVWCKGGVARTSDLRPRRSAFPSQKSLALMI